MVIDQFNNEVSHILTELQAHPKSLFLYLKTVIEVHLSGSINFDYLTKECTIRITDKYEEVEAYLKRLSDLPKFLRNNPVHVTDDMIELYLEVSTSRTIAKNTMIF